MLEIDNISVSYGAIEALRDVTISMGKGEVVSIIGANGAGKSTLLKALTGIEQPTKGRIVLDGQDITRFSPHDRVKLGMAMSPEGRMVFSDQSVADNLVLGAYASGVAKADVAARMERQFMLFPRLKERREQMSGTLSGGEQQMLAIARALMSEPKLLLLDEPSLGLAPLVTQEIFLTIRRLKDHGMTIMLVEQMANKALALSDRAYVLETGNIIIGGTGREIMKDKRVRDSYLGLH